MSIDASSEARRLAWHYLHVDRPERALQELSRIGGDALEHPDVWKVRAWALIDLDRYDEALDIATEAAGRWPEDVDVLRILTSANAHLGRLAEAERTVLGALRLAPDDAALLCQYADALMRAAQLDKAERVLDLAERSDPDALAVVRTRLTLAYLRGREKEARRLSEELLSYDAEDRQGQIMLGTLDLQKARPGAALDRLGTAVRQDPSATGVATAARAASAMRNPLAWPLWPFARFGVGPTWVAAIVVIFGLRAAGLAAAAGIATVVWIVLCVYSWIAGPILDRRAQRGDL